NVMPGQQQLALIVRPRPAVGAADLNIGCADSAGLTGDSEGSSAEILEIERAGGLSLTDGDGIGINDVGSAAEMEGAAWAAAAVIVAGAGGAGIADPNRRRRDAVGGVGQRNGSAPVAPADPEFSGCAGVGETAEPRHVNGYS